MFLNSNSSFYSLKNIEDKQKNEDQLSRNKEKNNIYKIGSSMIATEIKEAECWN